MKKIKSYAKVNLFLKVTKQLKNFHKLHSLIVQINLYDEGEVYRDYLHVYDVLKLIKVATQYNISFSLISIL